MKKYSSLADLIVDYREYHNLTQLDLASMLDVDVRTVLRWEKNESLIKVEKEKLFTEELCIPHQVMRNLNTDKPISIYYDIHRRVYSLSGISKKVSSESKFNCEVEINTSRIHLISKDSDIEFVSNIQKINRNDYPIKAEILKKAAKMLPDLNLIIYDHSGYYAGHITVLPLKEEIYLKIRNQEFNEGNIKTNDLTNDLTDRPLVFYFYSLYADSIDNAYYMINRLLTHFKRNKYEEYIFAGISSRKLKIELLQELGLKVIWEKPKENSDDIITFLDGNFDKYIFGE